MSKISDVYEGLKLVLSTLFDSKRELVDPITVEANADQILADGYGLAVGAATNTFRDLGCRYSIDREFTIVLTRQIRAIHNDIDEREKTEKALLEDHYLLTKEISKNETLNLLYRKINYLNDFGIETIVAEKKSFLMIRSTLSVEYFENLQ